MTQEVIEYLPLDAIASAPQIREEFDENAITGLAMSLRAVGQIAPIRVRRNSNGYVVVDGERRLRAAKKAGMSTISAIVEGTELSDGEILHRQLVANCQRVDLQPMEKARAIDRLMKSTGWSATEVGKQLGMSSATITRFLALLSMPAPIQEQVESGKLAASTAYEIARVADPVKQSKLASEAVSGGLTRAAVSNEAKKTRLEGLGVAAAMSRAVMKLPDERTIALSGPDLTVDTAILWLKELTGELRKAQAKGIELKALVKLLRDKTESREVAGDSAA